MVSAPPEALPLFHYWQDSIVLPRNIGQLPLLAPKQLFPVLCFIAYLECQKLESDFHMNQT